MNVFDAWIDESGSNQRVDPGTYILSAVISEISEVASAREAMRSLLVGKGHRKLHWRDENRGRQLAIARTVADLGLEHLVIVRSRPGSDDHPERQRPALHGAAVTGVGGIGRGPGRRGITRP